MTPATPRIRQAVVLAGAADPRVAGLSLVERAVLVLARAGLERVVVVGAPISDELRRRAGISLDAVAPDAALAALRRLSDPFVLADAGHVFDLALAKAAAGVVLGRDEEGVRVTPDAAAPGLVVASPRALDTLAAHATRPLAEAVAVLGGPARAVVVPDALWLPATTPAERAAAEDALFRALRKRVDGPVSRYLNRPISIFLTRRLVRTGVTPNQMTVVANAIGVLGIVLVFQATWLSVVLGAALVQAQSILDGCDGELARLKLQSSRLGEWLDNVLDDHVNIGYGLALGHAAAVQLDQPAWWWLGILAAVAYSVHNVVLYLQLALVHRTGNPFAFRWWFQAADEDLTAMLSKQDLGTRVSAAARALARRDLFLLAFLGLALVALPHVAVAWYGVIAVGHLVLVIVHVARGGLGLAAPQVRRA